MQFEQILYEKTGPIARITLNRPRVRNAQSRVLREEMDVAFADAADDDDIRVIVLDGAGDHFSSGHDIGTAEEKADMEARPYANTPIGQHRRSWDLNVANSLRWRDVPKPTIASVRGWCIFGGWIIASAMDLIIAADDAMFVPGLVQYFSMPWEGNLRKVKEVLFQQKPLNAVEAQELGFVNQVVPAADLEKETFALAERIAESDPFLLRMVKMAVNNVQDTMGFRPAIQSAHANYMMTQMSGVTRPVDRANGRPRLSGVAAAMRHLDKP